jgi:hypothetical protein
MDNKIDPKLTAAKVYPIDQIAESYDEEAYPEGEPEINPMSFYERVAGVVAGAAVFACLAYAFFH